MIDFDDGLIVETPENMPKPVLIDIGKYCKYVREQEALGRKVEDLTREEVEQFLLH